MLLILRRAVHLRFPTESNANEIKKLVPGDTSIDKVAMPRTTILAGHFHVCSYCSFKMYLPKHGAPSASTHENAAFDVFQRMEKGGIAPHSVSLSRAHASMCPEWRK